MPLAASAQLLLQSPQLRPHLPHKRSLHLCPYLAKVEWVSFCPAQYIILLSHWPIHCLFSPKQSQAQLQKYTCPFWHH